MKQTLFTFLLTLICSLTYSQSLDFTKSEFYFSSNRLEAVTWKMVGKDLKRNPEVYDITSTVIKKGTIIEFNNSAFTKVFSVISEEFNNIDRTTFQCIDKDGEKVEVIVIPDVYISYYYLSDDSHEYIYGGIKEKKKKRIHLK